MDGETATVTDPTKAKTSERERSKIGFPYMDLKSAIELADAIHTHVGLGECDDDQLAAWTNQSPKSSTFRVQIYAARMFGLLDGGSKHKLTELGRAIVDPQQNREARANAFLTVPLYKVVFEKYKGGVVPPAAALGRDMVGLGVSEKQKERARQVFERSAERAGFFEHGKNRLVLPGFAARTHAEEPKREELHREEEEKGGKGGGGGGGDDLGLDPLLIALLKKIPVAEKGSWPAAQRIRWFKTFAMNVSQIYDEDDNPVEMDIKGIET